MGFIDNEVGQTMEPRGAASAVGVAEIKHDSIRDQLSDYLDNSLAEADRGRVEEHLARCQSCRAFKSTLRATSQAVANLPREKVAAPARQRLMQIPDA